MLIQATSNKNIFKSQPKIIFIKQGLSALSFGSQDILKS